MSIGTILIILLIVILLGGGVGYVGPQYNWDTTHYSGLGLIVVILVILLLFGRIR